MHIKQHTVQEMNQKSTTAVNFVQLKLHWKPQFFFAKPNQSHFLATTHPYTQITHPRTVLISHFPQKPGSAQLAVPFILNLKSSLT